MSDKHLNVLLDFLSEKTTEDDLHEMILCCYEAWNIQKRKPAEHARAAIADGIKKRKCEASTLYNKRRNISLDQCFGESKTPAADFLNLTEWREWE